jgi:hypothetical protein
MVLKMLSDEGKMPPTDATTEIENAWENMFSRSVQLGRFFFEVESSPRSATKASRKETRNSNGL